METHTHSIYMCVGDIVFLCTYFCRYLREKSSCIYTPDLQLITLNLNDLNFLRGLWVKSQWEERRKKERKGKKKGNKNKRTRASAVCCVVFCVVCVVLCVLCCVCVCVCERERERERESKLSIWISPQ